MDKVAKEEIIIREYLASDRTHLANERTLLAYWRTALAFAALGPVMIKFFPAASSLILGMAFIAFGIGLFVYGTLRYRKMKQRISDRLS